MVYKVMVIKLWVTFFNKYREINDMLTNVIIILRNIIDFDIQLL